MPLQSNHNHHKQGNTVFLMPTPPNYRSLVSKSTLWPLLDGRGILSLVHQEGKNKTKQPTPILLKTQPHLFVKSKAVQLIPQGLGHTTLPSHKMYFDCLGYKETGKNESALLCRNSQIWRKVLNMNKKLSSTTTCGEVFVTLMVAVQDQYLSAKIL